jgi:hypothetical protein
VKTNNNPLTYIFDQAKLDDVGHRWVASLSNYDFNLTYRAGKANGDAYAVLETRHLCKLVVIPTDLPFHYKD